jgi:DNA-binding HxlR family transcriptional regulator
MQLHKRVMRSRDARTKHAPTSGNSGADAMVKRTSLEGDPCPIARSLDAIGDWWSLLIIRDAFMGRRRFGEFQRSLGLAKNILTVRLRELVDRGILTTEPASDGSAYRDYVLTAKGRGLFPILVALRQWSEEFDERPQEIATMLVDRRNGRPVRKLALCADDGRVLAAVDTELRARPTVPSGDAEAGSSREQQST